MNRLEALRARIAAGERPDFLFFWGHSGNGPGPQVLSQWWEASFAVEGVTYRTAEHWMMAQKALLFGDEATLAEVLAAPTPGAAKALGRKVAGFDEDEWVRHRFAIVRTGNVAKFGQHPDLRDWLLSTGDKVLVEASPQDRVWGIGRARSDAGIGDPATWRGENLLGFALGEARDRLRRVPEPIFPVGGIEPPWRAFPGVHPFDIHWRMGAGESHLMGFQEWWATLDPNQRLHVEGARPAQGPWSGWYDPDDGEEV